MMWKANKCLIFSSFDTKRIFLTKLGKTRVWHIVCYHSLSICKEIPNFHSFLFIGTVLSPPPLISRPLCAVQLIELRSRYFWFHRLNSIRFSRIPRMFSMYGHRVLQLLTKGFNLRQKGLERKKFKVTKGDWRSSSDSL